MAVGEPGTVLSDSTLTACHQIAEHNPNSGVSLVLICSEDAATRRAYLRRPSNEDWLALERGGFVATQGNFGFVLDGLH